MADDRDARWAQYAQVGIEEIRKRLGARQYGEQEPLVREWLAHQESLEASGDRRAIFAEAKAANDLARSANDAALEANDIARSAADSASVSAAAARTNNIIATLALIAATIAIALSIIGMFVKP